MKHSKNAQTHSVSSPVALAAIYCRQPDGSFMTIIRKMTISKNT